MFTRRFTLFTLLVLLTLLVAAIGCGAPAAPTTAPTTAPTSVPPTTAPTLAPTAVPPTTAPTVAPTSVPPTTAPTVAPTAVPPTTAPSSITVKDSAGREVTFQAVPQRIISLAPSTTEIVFALGAGDKIVGADQFSDYPAAAKNLPRISDGFNPNYEQIIAAKPDLVLAAGITSADAIKKLEELKLSVLVIGTEKTSFENTMQEIRLVAKVLGAADQAEQIVKKMQDKIADVKARVAKATTKPRVFWELDATDPAKPYTTGPGSYVDELIKLAGGENVGANLKSPYAQVNAEEVIRANPEIIILSDAAYGVAPESVGKRPGWDVIAAVKNNKVFPIDDNLVSRPGPRLAEGLEAAAKLIHPEVFETAVSGSQTSYTDPFAYCAAAGTIDAPDARYTGPKLPDAIAQGLRKALGGVSIPDDVFAAGTSWRCMNGQVYACNVGANLPCSEKADTSRTPSAAMNDFCKQNPTSQVIPMAVTGRATVYKWACENGAPQVVKQFAEADAAGFIANIWYQINP